MKHDIIHGDCLEVMESISDGVVDMVLCDLPYGTTQCSWDQIIPFELLWAHYKRIVKPTGAIVLTASQPFTSALVMSNTKMFRYEWIWNKKNHSNFLNAKKEPLKIHESMVVFSTTVGLYTPQMVQGKFRDKGSSKKVNNGQYGKHEGTVSKNDQYYPKSIVEISNAVQEGKVHPTQKPVALFEYLLKTYTREGDLVLDNCAGSGTTTIAAINTNRQSISIEKEEKYIQVITERLLKHVEEMPFTYEEVSETHYAIEL